MIINGMENERINDYILKEIDLLEKCIERMAKNSFEIRKWTVGIISIISGIASSSEKRSVMILCFVIICIFWYLDAYYLRYERMYVNKYNWIVNNRTNENLKGLMDLNPRNQYVYNANEVYNQKKFSIWTIMMSVTLKYFYGVLLVGIIFVYMIM